ncbi:MAG TPA: hypothetical protein VGH16_23480 [Candidatus Binatia bacterium]|jgi:hypothetical protein
MILWRPVGLNEMALVFDSGMAAFPPRLPEQPIFYPVLNKDYAVQIARDWNTKESPFAGYVLRFEITDNYATTFETRTVGGGIHRELWIPAERLAEFNAQIIGPIVTAQAFFGKNFRGFIPDAYGLKGLDAFEQIAALAATMDYAIMDFGMEIMANAKTIFLNFPFWKAAGSLRLNIEADPLNRCLEKIRSVWSMSPRGAELVEDAAFIE